MIKKQFIIPINEILNIATIFSFCFMSSGTKWNSIRADSYDKEDNLFKKLLNEIHLLI